TNIESDASPCCTIHSPAAMTRRLPAASRSRAASGRWKNSASSFGARADVAEVAEVADELRHIAQGYVHTAKIDGFLHHPDPFPVDIRHNAKIGREKLAAWAAARAAGGA
ncbi:MAG TPA: hypothetical protein VK034_01830, partial [Enhygromyxa sp.]|nr:hypothetical protein [Enhygromyxa sp.]